jgi:uncharacterized tellurite resistance protein B-like protein
MENFSLGAAGSVALIASLRLVADADGELHRGEEKLLLAAGSALGVSEPLSIAPQSPEETAAQVGDPRSRERIVQAMIMMALMDEKASAVEVELIEHAARVLGVDEPRVRSLRLLCEGRILSMWTGIARRSFARKTFADAMHEEGLAGVWHIVAPMVGLGRDPALARRYISLGELPDGTLGRAYFDFIVGNDLGFPGEGIVAERGVWHDLSHVLGGYGTDPRGEVQVVSFIAGYRKEDPFFWLFTIALQFHLGIKVSPYSPGDVRGCFEPEVVLKALRRGMAMNRDLSDGWDYVPELSLPLAEIRARHGVR